MTKKVILCDCAGSQSLDSAALEQVGLSCSACVSELCGKDLDIAARAIADGDALIACQQERAVFEDLSVELQVESPGFVDLRDRAGWSDDTARAGPKMAALAAEALIDIRPAPAMDVVSQGVCLIVGAGDVVLPLAQDLAASLTVTVLLTDEAEPPLTRDFDVVRGRLRRVSGALGGFDVTLDAVQEMRRAGRSGFEFEPPRDGGTSGCDILIDLTGGVPFVPTPQKRDGYLRADPRDPLAVARLGLQAVALVGGFEKPLYVRLEDSLCAHSRAGQVGCSNCLDVCPTGAITPSGDHVAIDPAICAGCGACAALCPSTAITYEDPPIEQIVRRLQILARTYREAGGTAPRLLVHDGHGAEMIRLAARFGRGLPADVIPMELSVVSGFGHAEMLAALGQGFASLDLLLAPTTEREALDREVDLAVTIAGAGKLTLLDLNDPDALSDHLYTAHVPVPLAEPVMPLGNRRQVARLAAQALRSDVEIPIPLPAGAPYGATVVDKEACTLCLSCVSLCPSGALLDNPDLPQLRFQEDACLQCGICVTICPEDAITLEPQLDLSDAALTQRVQNEEEPFACVECGTLFGAKSTIERIMEKLSGTHPMFATSEQARMIQMCDDCRIQAQVHSENNPFAAGERPRVRTTSDYYSDRKDH